jgi:hypothetical protein
MEFQQYFSREASARSVIGHCALVSASTTQHFITSHPVSILKIIFNFENEIS